MASRRRPLALAIATSALLAGCSSGEQTVEGPVTVYVSLPLTGPRAADGNDAADGARLALEQAGGRAGDLDVQAEFLDGSSGAAAWDPVVVGENARKASQDSSTAVYIGELDSEPTRTSLPITNEAGIVQISPGAGGVDLTRAAEGYPDAPDRYRPAGDATFVRLVAADDEVARAAAESAPRDALTARIVTDGSLYGDLAAEEMTRGAEGGGLDVRPNGDADVVLYAGGPEGAGAALQAADEAGAQSVISTDAAGESLLRPGPGAGAITVLGTLSPLDLPGSFAADFRSAYEREPGPYAAYGFEAMALALQGIDDAEGEGEFRPAIRDAVLGADREDSVLGAFTVSDEGVSSLCSLSTVAVGRAAQDAPAPLCPD